MTAKTEKTDAPVVQPQQSPASTAVSNLVTMCEDKFSPVLGHGGIDWPGFALGVRAAVLKNPQLVGIIQQNPAPLIQALSQAAALELSPHPDLHHFYLVPFKGQIQALIGYRGLIELAMRSGLVEDVHSFVLYRDEVETLRAANLMLIDAVTGEPNIHPDNRLLDGKTRTDEEIVGAIAVVRVKGRGRPVTRAMTRDEIEKRRNAGQGNTPAWTNWYPEQCCKTVIRSVLKSGRVPLGKQSDAIRDAITEEVEPAQVIETSRPRLAEPKPPTEHERRDAEPFPPAEQVATELLEELWVAADKAGLSTEQVEHLVAEKFDGSALADLGVDALRKVIGMVGDPLGEEDAK